MTREITRHSTSQDEKEACLFGGPFWNDWKHSLLDKLKISSFPDEFTEEVLHKWWVLRMKLKRKLISESEFDELKKELFPENGEVVRILDEEPDSVLSRGISYITEVLGDKGVLKEK